jgi:hypothetical protein
MTISNNENLNFNEKIAICYTCCGPTYRKTALEKLKNLHIDNLNLYYFIITDDKSYFEGVTRQNLIVNELKDFYIEYPELEKYESFLESTSVEDYAKKFIDQDYKFPFSTNRFHFKQAEKFGIHNIAMLGTDTDINLNVANIVLSHKNILYNSISRWPKNISENNMMHIVNILKEKYNLNVDNEVMVFDAAAKLFLFQNVEKMNQFFEIWNDIMFTLYKEDKIKKYFPGWYAINDEYILAPIYNALGFKPPLTDNYQNLFNPKHNPSEERFWMC